jgi:hypothetical protein
MLRAATYAALLLGAAGCLGDLVKPPGNDGGSIGGDGGPGRDADPDAGDPDGFDGDLAIRITTMVVDLNGNGFPDLVLLNDPPTPADRGVLVYFDREEGFFAAPDRFLPTDSLHPLVATTGDFVGGAPIDLMVIATSDDDTPYVALFENSGASTFTETTIQGFPGRQLTAGSVTSPTPVFASRVFIRGSTEVVPGLVFGDSDLALYLTPDDWSQVTAADELPLDVGGTTTMNVALPLPSEEDDRNDLLVLDNQGGYWLENDGSEDGGYQAGPSELPGLWLDFNRAFFVFDLGIDAVPDFMTLDRMDLRVGSVSWTAPENLDVDVRQLDPAPDFVDDFGEALFAVDVDGTGGVDLLVLDLDLAGREGQFVLHAARNLENDGAGTITTSSGRIDVDASHSGEPTRLVAGDFDHDGVVEVWLFDAALEGRLCLIGEVYSADNYRFNECE